MAGIIVGEQERSFVKGSSKPKVEETLETKLRSMITPELTYKDGNSVMNVVDIRIQDYFKYKPIKNPYRDYNFEFEGNAQIGIKASNGISYALYSFRGYFLSDDVKEIKSLYDEIQITK